MNAENQTLNANELITMKDHAAFLQVIGSMNRNELKALKVAVNDHISQLNAGIDAMELDGSDEDFRDFNSKLNRTVRARGHIVRKASAIDAQLAKGNSFVCWIMNLNGKWVACQEHPMDWLTKYIQSGQKDAKLEGFHPLNAEQWDRVKDKIKIAV